MRIGVLEWASCGGMAGSPELHRSIRTEGWAMCRAALVSLVRGGHQAVAVVDPQCAIDPLVSGYRADELELVELSAREAVCNQWQRVYASCESTLVVAPESDHILSSLLKWCDRNQIRTCNCSDTFVSQASDKWQTAKLFQAQGVPHPPTQLLVDAERQWRAEPSAQQPSPGYGEEQNWVIKPIDGAGCEGMLRVTANELCSAGGFASQLAHAARRELSEQEPSRWIVQPWLSGRAYSRSAIAEPGGRLHWLPVTRQHLSFSDRVTYLGGSVEPEFAPAGLDELLTRAVHALGGQPRGWVGIDFLHDARNERQPVTIIEINPRLTTSFVGLASAGAPGLAASIVAAAQGRPVELPSQWQTIRFTAAGEAFSG